MIGSDVPQQPLVIRDPQEHSMGWSLHRYVATRVHEFLDDESYRRIVVTGSYDRSVGISKKEKTDKLENWQRPTAEVDGNELRIHCFPGRAYVFHYGSLIATHLALSQRDPSPVEIELPPHTACEEEIARAGFSALEPTSVLVVASGNDMLAPADAVWLDYGTFAKRIERIDRSEVTWLAVKHSFWGDIAYHLGRALAKAGFPLVIFVGKLGSLVPDHEPNVTLASGCSSLLGKETISWSNVFRDRELASGRHVTLPSVLQETVAWTHERQSQFEFVDPEIGNLAAGVVEGGSRFSYLHLVSDNLSRKYAEDLSNERAASPRNRRGNAYTQLGKILRNELLRQVSSV